MDSLSAVAAAPPIRHPPRPTHRPSLAPGPTDPTADTVQLPAHAGPKPRPAAIAVVDAPTATTLTRPVSRLIAATPLSLHRHHPTQGSDGWSFRTWRGRAPVSPISQNPLPRGRIQPSARPNSDRKQHSVVTLLLRQGEAEVRPRATVTLARDETRARLTLASPRRSDSAASRARDAWASSTAVVSKQRPDTPPFGIGLPW